MPELPEVETVARSLRAHLVGQLCERVEHVRADMLDVPLSQLRRGLEGQEVLSVERCGKFVVIATQDGHFIVHLGMSGRLVYVADTSLVPPTHTHAIIRLGGGDRLFFVDPRCFGRLMWGQGSLSDAAQALGLGPDALSQPPTDAWWWEWRRGTSRPLKAFLLDQRRIAGIGNIYADEICHAARVSPHRRVHRLTREQCARLALAAPEILASAVARGGTTLRDYRDVDGKFGSYGEHLAVYGRAGQPCHTCARPLHSARLAGRTTVWCGICQE